MKKTVLLSVFLSIAFLINAQQKQKTPMYSIKSGYIKYELTGNTTGTEEMWWTDYGNKTKKKTKGISVTKILGIKKKEEIDNVEIRNKDRFYSMDNIKNENTATTITYNPISDDMTEAEQKAFAEQIFNDLGGERLGKEDVKGYTCEKIKLLGSLIWSYKGISLKSDIKILGMKVFYNFTEFKPNAKVDTLLFEPPAGVEFKEIEQPDMQDVEILPTIEKTDSSKVKQDDTTNNNLAAKYPYDLFKKKVKSFKPQGYIRTVLPHQDDQHLAMFVKGIFKRITVMSSSRENLNKNEDSYEKFTHKGRTYYYLGDTKHEGKKVSSLTIEIPEYDSIILFIFSFKVSKEDALEIADKFKF